MANFLDSLGIGGGADVYVTVSASGSMEMAVLDAHNEIKSYAKIPLDYNDSIREIADYTVFQNSLVTLYERCNVNPQKANVHLSLPTIWFGFKDSLPLLLDDDAITSVVTGELEQTYIFKRKDPVPYWFDASVTTNSDSRSVFYTAIQKDIIDTLKDCVKNSGANLLDIGISLFANFRALYSTGIASALMDSENSWTLMVVNNSGFQTYNMQGKKILEYYEEPVAIKSYEGDEVYNEIVNSAQIALMSSPSTSLLILSETDLVSAEILAQSIQFSGEILAVEDNQFKKEPFPGIGLNVIKEKQLGVSLHILGLIAPEDVFPNNVNFLVVSGKKSSRNDVIEIPIGNGQTVKLTPLKCMIVAGSILAVVATVLGVLFFATDMAVKNLQSKINSLDSQIGALDSELSNYDQKDNGNFDPEKEIENVLKNNRIKIMSYTALGESIPKNLYLTYYMSGDNGMIDIKGSADSVEDVYLFFKNLKDSLVDSNLRLNKLDLKAGSIDSVVNSTVSSIDDAPYIFEITNMNEEQLKAFMNLLTGKKDENKNNSNAGNNSQQPQNQNGGSNQPPAQQNAPAPDKGVPQEEPTN